MHPSAARRSTCSGAVSGSRVSRSTGGRTPRGTSTWPLASLQPPKYSRVRSSPARASASGRRSTASQSSRVSGVTGGGPRRSPGRSTRIAKLRLSVPAAGERDDAAQ
eukprot:2439435-Prymnesium_polylepis.1